jgi:hypothetical protein
MRPLGLVFSPWPVKARVTKISCGVGTMSNAPAQVACEPVVMWMPQGAEAAPAKRSVECLPHNSNHRVQT